MWALKERVQDLEEQLRQVREEGSIDALVRETHAAMDQWGDGLWADRKQEVFQDLWSGDMQGGMTLLHSKFPSLAKHVYKLVLPDRIDYTTSRSPQPAT